MQFAATRRETGLLTRTMLPLAIVVLAVVGLRGPLLSIPFERDEGEYAYIAWRSQHGELPYRNWVDQKPPGIFWVYQLALKLPLDPVRAVHFAAMLVSAASACALYLLATRYMSRFWAGAAAVLFTFLLADPVVQGTAANTELFMLLPIILAQLALTYADASVRRSIGIAILSGVLTGIAAAFKQVGAVNWFFLVGLYPIMIGGDRRLGRTLVFAFWSAIGVSAVWVGLALHFWLAGGLNDFIRHVLTHNLEYVGGLNWRARFSFFKAAVVALSSSEALTWCFAVVGLVSLYLARRIRWLIFLAAWMVTSLVGVSASGYFFPHYFIQLLPALALAAAAGGEALEGAWWLKGVQGGLRKSLLCLMLIVLPAAVIRPFIFSYTPQEGAAKIYPGEPFAVMPVVGRRIAELTKPEDRVFIFGAEPEVLFYSKRASATRYIFLFPLYGPYRNAREDQMKTAVEVAKARPAVVLYFPNSLFSIAGSEQYFTGWTKAYLQKQFRADSWLIMDHAGDIRLVPVAHEPDIRAREAQSIVGTLFMRTNASPTISVSPDIEGHHKQRKINSGPNLTPGGSNL